MLLCSAEEGVYYMIAPDRECEDCTCCRFRYVVTLGSIETAEDDHYFIDLLLDGSCDLITFPFFL